MVPQRKPAAFIGITHNVAGRRQASDTADIGAMNAIADKITLRDAGGLMRYRAPKYARRRTNIIAIC